MNQLLVINLSYWPASLENPNLHLYEESFLTCLPCSPSAGCLSAPFLKQIVQRLCIKTESQVLITMQRGPALFLTLKNRAAAKHQLPKRNMQCHEIPPSGDLTVAKPSQDW